jgi:hypothetical protein
MMNFFLRVIPLEKVCSFFLIFNEELSDFKIPVFSLVYRGTYRIRKSTGIPVYRTPLRIMHYPDNTLHVHTLD